MFDCSDLNQVGVMLWEDKHKNNEDQVQQKNEEYIRITFGECSKKQRDENPTNSMSSMVETSGAKRVFLNCNIEKSSANSCLDCNDSILQMDPWPDLTYLSSVLNDDFNDRSHEDSIVTELMNDLADTSILSPGLGIMTSYNDSSKLCSVSAGDAMELDSETELFCNDDNGKYGFLNDDWAIIPDLDDLHKNFFENNDCFDRNEEIHSANSFHNTSADITSSSFQSIAVPDLQRSVEQTFDTGSPFDQLCEHSDANVNCLPEKKADGQSQTSKSQEEEGKGLSFQFLDYSNSSKNRPMSSSELQDSNENPSHIIQSPLLGQASFNHGAIFSDHEYLTPLPQACVESNQLKPKNGGFKANMHCSNDHNISKKAVAAGPKAIMTPREKIEKLKRRKKMQAIPQKQCDNYGHQIFSTDECVSQECLSKNQNQDTVPSINAMEEHKQKPLTPKISFLEEQDRSYEMPSSISGRSLEVAVYNQLQCAMQKLDLKVRLNIRDSLFRLARSAKERLNARDRRSSDKNEISMEGESKNNDRYFSMSDSERVTNLIDRSVADLLFHDSSVSYSLPIGDGNVAMATCM